MKLEFAVVSDTHLASKYERLNELHSFYNDLKKYGINLVLHAGDITDGVGVYKGQENCIKVYNTDEQAEYTKANYPKIKGIETKFITGNHDLRAWDKGGADVGKLINEMRPDLKYLGRYSQRVNIEGFKIDIVHPAGGMAYALSYPAQKYVNGLEGGTKPDVLIFGHRHQSIFMGYRNIFCFDAGCFQGQNDFTKRRGINPQVGGWIIQLNRLNAKEIEITPKFKKYY